MNKSISFVLTLVCVSQAAVYADESVAVAETPKDQAEVNVQAITRDTKNIADNNPVEMQSREKITIKLPEAIPVVKAIQ